MKRVVIHPDLFAWADARQSSPQRSAEVIDFLARRPQLPRWILTRPSELDVAIRTFDRRAGFLPPAPVFPFKREA